MQVPKREEAGSGRSSGSFLDSGTSCEGGAGGRGSHTSDSLNLSQHNTETTVRLSRLTEMLSLKQSRAVGIKFCLIRDKPSNDRNNLIVQTYIITAAVVFPR